MDSKQFPERESFEEIEIKHLGILREVCTRIRAQLEWHMRGAKKNHDKQRMDDEWIQAENEVDRYLSNKSSKDIATILSEFVELQANLFWSINGAVKDDDIERQKNDYFNAKRYLGFLIAEIIINKCLTGKNQKPSDCMEYLREEYIQYLVTISIEEYIRIKAYFLWGKENDWRPLDDPQAIERYYFYVQQEMENSHHNCHKFCYTDWLPSIPQDVKTYFMQQSVDSIDVITKAKEFTDSRLNIDHPNEVREYTQSVYNEMKSLFRTPQINAKNTARLLELMYAHSDIPNMLEYFLRCLLCSFTDIETHNDIRNRFNKPPIKKKCVEIG